MQPTSVYGLAWKELPKHIARELCYHGAHRPCIDSAPEGSVAEEDLGSSIKQGLATDPSLLYLRLVHRQPGRWVRLNGRAQIRNLHCIEAVDQLLREHVLRLQIAVQETEARVQVCYAVHDLAEDVA